MTRERIKDERAAGTAAFDLALDSRKDAPWDDEPLTADDKQAIAEANADYTAGRVVSQEELRQELGI